MGRIHAFDWLRGIAVLVMIQTHSLVLLTPATHKDPLFAFLVRIDGLVAPAFIFCAGFAIALVQCRAAMAGHLRSQAFKSFKRIGEVLLVASFVNFVWFPVLREPKWLLRIDILQCIGLSLLLVLPLLVGLSNRPRVLRWVMLGLAGIVFTVSPLFEKTGGFIGIFLNAQPGFLDDATATVFPLLPWAGYVFLGASTGATIASMKREADLWLWLGLQAGIGIVLWSQQTELAAAYPPHRFWVTNPANAAQRWVIVIALVALLRVIETQAPSTVTSRPVKWLTVFSASSLWAYVFHEMLIYQRWVGVFARFWRESADWPLYWLLLASLIIATWWCVRGWGALNSWAAQRRSAS